MITQLRKRCIGILTCESLGEPPFANQSFYRRLCLLGSHLGMHVIVFSPLRIDWSSQQLSGYSFSHVQKKWIKAFFPIPEIIYDRCFYNNKQNYLRYKLPVRKLREYAKGQFLSCDLKGKWSVQQALLQEPNLRPYLPETFKLTSYQPLVSMLKHKGEAILKPQSGSQGKGIMHICHTADHLYQLRGRDRTNQIMVETFSEPYSMLRWIKQFVGRQHYLVQNYLNLTSKEGNSFDIRSLMQKNGKGVWQLTGMAVRQGIPGSVTSNLHGGGHCEDVSSFLVNEFGATRAEELITILHQLSDVIPQVLERSFGKFVELGLDLGIDTSGNVWVLEVNSKPGRNAFASLNNKELELNSVNNPILYARYLLDRQLGG